MTKLETFLRKVDSIAPTPWIVDGVEQARPVTQLGVLLGIAIGSLIICFL